MRLLSTVCAVAVKIISPPHGAWVSESRRVNHYRKFVFSQTFARNKVREYIINLEKAHKHSDLCVESKVLFGEIIKSSTAGIGLQLEEEETFGCWQNTPVNVQTRNSQLG